MRRGLFVGMTLLSALVVAYAIGVYGIGLGRGTCRRHSRRVPAPDLWRSRPTSSRRRRRSCSDRYSSPRGCGGGGRRCTESAGACISA
jgi:hypothetical protein